MKRLLRFVPVVFFSVIGTVLPKQDRAAFFTFFWWSWLLMLVIADPIASWLGTRDRVGDSYTDTHLLVTHLNQGLRWAVLGWLIYHFTVAHRFS
jgi:hypothetical protein